MADEVQKCPHCGSENVKYLEKAGLYFCKSCDNEFQIQKPAAPMRIFLSYGHDGNEELVRRIKADLEERGHDVWFDKSEIKFGDDWRRSITDGILKSHRVLSFLSKHSTRDPGVCRDEIAISIGVKDGNIQTILVESESEVQPPVNIGHIQWLDMHDWKDHRKEGGNAWEDWYQEKLDEIVRVVESEESRRFAGEIEKLNNYLKPIKSEARICRLLSKVFYGREWLFDAVENWRLETSRESRLFWIMGDPGVGKSAFVAQLTHTRSDTVIAAQFVEWDKPDHRDARRVVRSIAFQLATRLPDYRKLLLTLPEISELDQKDEKELFEYLLSNPLKTAIQGGRDRYFIVIDALDEGSESGRNPLVEMLARNAKNLPAWLGIVVTSRPEFDVKTALQGLKPFPLDTQTESNRSDICDYLQRELALQLQNHPNPKSIVEQIFKKSEGVFLYAERFCSDIRQGYLSLDHPEQFPQGMGEVYQQFFDRQFGKNLPYYKKEIRPILCMISAAFEPLQLGFLMRIMGYNTRMELFDHLDCLGSLFPRSGGEDADTITVFHRSLADWITKKDKSGVYFVDVQYGHRLLCEFGWREYTESVEKMSRYSLEWLPVHLSTSEKYNDLIHLLKDFDYLMVKTKAGMLERLLSDYRDLVSKAPQEIRQQLQIEESFFRERSHFLRRGDDEWPAYKILFQISIEHADDSPLTNGAECYLNEGKVDWIYLRRMQRLKEAGTGISFCHSVFEGHTHAVMGALVFPDGKILSWAGYGENTIRIWDSDGRPLSVLEGHTDVVRGAQVLPDGRLLSRSQDGNLRIWDSDGRPLAVLEGHTDLVWGAKVLADGRILSWSKDNTLRIWDVDGRLLAVLEGHTDSVWGAKVLADGRILSWSKDNTLRIWDVDGRLLAVLKGHTDSVWGALILPNKRILSWSSDETLRVWGADGYPLTVFEGHTSSVMGALIIPDERILSWSQDSTLRIWCFDGRLLSVLKGHKGAVKGALTLPSGRILSWSRDNTLRIWDRDGRLLSVLKGHKGGVEGALTLPSGRILSWAEGWILRIWDEDGHSLAVLRGHLDIVGGAQVLPNGQILSWSLDKTLRIWNPDGCPLPTLEAHSEWAHGGKLLSKGRILTWSADRTLRIWDSDGHSLNVLKGHSKSVSGALVFPDGRILSWSDADKTLRIWSADGHPLSILEEHTDTNSNLIVGGAQVFPDGRILSWLGGKNLHIWDTIGRSILMLKGHTKNVRGALVFPDGQILSWADDITHRIWGTDGKQVSMYEGQENYGIGAQSLADGRVLSWIGDILRIFDSNGRPMFVFEGYSDSSRDSQMLPDGRVLSWSFNDEWRIFDSSCCILNDTFHIWDIINRAGLEKMTFIELCSNYPGYLPIILGKKLCYAGLFSCAEGKYGRINLSCKGKDRIMCALWHAESESTPFFLGKDGTLILAQLNGQVSFLKLYKGKERISLDELLSLKGGATFSYEQQNREVKKIKSEKEKRNEYEKVLRKGLEYHRSNYGSNIECHHGHLCALISFLEKEGRHEEANELGFERDDLAKRLKDRLSMEDATGIRSQALSHFRDGAYEKAENDLRRLLEAKFEVPGTHCHLSRVLIMQDRIDEAQTEIQQAWEHCNEAPAYVIPRIIWFQALFNCLKNSTIAQFIGRMKSALRNDDAFMQWDMELVLDHVKPRLTPDHYELLSTLVDALSARKNLSALDRFTAWRDAVPIPLEDGET